MANIFQRSFNDLLQELRTEAAVKSGSPDPTAGRYGPVTAFVSPTQGRLLQAGEPAPTPSGQPMPRATVPAQAPVLPPGYISPTNQAAMAAGQRATQPGGPVPIYGQSATQPGGPAPGVLPIYDVSRMPTMQPTGNVSGNVPPNMPPVLPVGPTQPAAAQQGPTTTQQGPAPQTTQQGPAPQTSGQPFVSMGEQGLNIPEKVTTKIDRPGHSETHSIQAKPPKQTGQAAAPSQGGGAPAVPTAPAVRPAQPASQATGPWTYGAPPASQATGPWTYGAPPGQGQGQNVNLQVPSHPGLLERIGQTISHFFSGTLGQHQQPAQPTSPYRPGYGPPESNALSGVSRALASGRQQVASRGGSAPASAPAPAPPGFSTPASFMGEEGESTLAATTPPEGATQIVTDPRTGIQHWADKDKKIIQ